MDGLLKFDRVIGFSAKVKMYLFIKFSHDGFFLENKILEVDFWPVATVATTRITQSMSERRSERRSFSRERKVSAAQFFTKERKESAVHKNW